MNIEIELLSLCVCSTEIRTLESEVGVGAHGPSF